MSGTYCVCKHLIQRHFVDTLRCSQCPCDKFEEDTDAWKDTKEVRRDDD